MVFFWGCFNSCGGGGRGRRRRQRRESSSWQKSIIYDHPLYDSRLRVAHHPRYVLVSRSDCPLLRHCWEQDWDAALRRVKTNPSEALAMTADTHRTALHYATMPGAGCPRKVLEALLEANPHASTVSDRHRHGGTPLHFLCGGRHRDDPELVRLFIRAAVRAVHPRAESEDDKHQTYPPAGRIQSPYRCSDDRCYVPCPPCSFSPLDMAARKNASPETLCALVDAAARYDETDYSERIIGTVVLHNPPQRRDQGRNSQSRDFGILSRDSCDFLASAATEEKPGPFAPRESVTGVTWIAPVTGGEPYWWRWMTRTMAGQSGHPPPLIQVWGHVHHHLLRLEIDEDSSITEQLRLVTKEVLSPQRTSSCSSKFATWSSPASSQSSSYAMLLTNRTNAVTAWASLLVLLRPHVPSPAGLLHAVANLSIRHAPHVMATIVVELYRTSCCLFPDLLKERDSDGHTPLLSILLRPASDPDPGETVSTSVASPSSSSTLWTNRIMPELVHWSLYYAPDCAMLKAGEPSDSSNPGSRGCSRGCDAVHEGLCLPLLLAASRNAPLSVIYDLANASIPTICSLGHYRDDRI